MIESATGIILRTRPLTETSLIVNWLTREHGRISTVAKGAHRAKSPFAGKLDLFYRADFTFTRSKRSELHTLREVRLKETHPVLRSDLDALRQAAYCAALIEQATERDTPMPPVFELMRALLEQLSHPPPQTQTIFAFELKLLHELGLTPDLDESKLPPGSRRIAEALITGDWPAITRLKLSAAQTREFRQFLHGFLIFHLGHIPKGRVAAIEVAIVGRVSPPGVRPDSDPDHDTAIASNHPPPRRLRRLHRVWPDREGNISYLLTVCVDERKPVLDNEAIFSRLVTFLFNSRSRYHWFGRRFVIMPDHLHLIAHMGRDAISIGQWVKSLKAVVGGLEPREESVETRAAPTVGRVSSPGDVPHEFNRAKHEWRWQEGFHDHKFRKPESEQRKWEYVCLNPVRAGLVKRPEAWPFGGEIFYDEGGGPSLVRGTPALLEVGMLIEGDSDGGATTPGEDTRPTR